MFCLCICLDVCVCVCVAVVFILQYLFDEAQIMADNVGPPVNGDQWQYIYRLGLQTKHSLANVS